MKPEDLIILQLVFSVSKNFASGFLKKSLTILFFGIKSRKNIMIYLLHQCQGRKYFNRYLASAVSFGMDRDKKNSLTAFLVNYYHLTQ